jgi:hypothetical protein
MAAWGLGRRGLGPDIKVHMIRGASNGDEYPLDLNGFVRQCAWCRRVADAEGRYRLIADRLIQGASHGCCEACAIRFLSLRSRGDTLAA